MMDNDTLEMLDTSLRHVLTEQSDAPLADRLAELGWDEVVADDPVAALSILFRVKGDTVAGNDALGPRLAAALADSLGDPALATATVGLDSPFGGSDATDSGLTVEVLTLSAPTGTLVFALGGAARLAVVDGTRLSCTALHGTDEGLTQYRVTGAVAAADVSYIDGASAASAWAAMQAHGRWLLATELHAIALHVIKAAAQYTGERIQYGKPIGTFQALQHRVASAYAMVVGTGHLAEHAATSGDAWSAMVAKAMAGQTAEFACTQAQQCYGAIGFTWEHEFHRYLRRTYVLDRLLGDWRTLEREIGTTLMASGEIPYIGML